MALPDLTGQNIQDTYKRVLTVGGGGNMYDGTGSLFIPLSASIEVTKEVSSSFADTAAALVMEPSITVTHITASGNISAVTLIVTGDISSSGDITASAIYADTVYTSGESLYVGSEKFTETHLEDLKEGKSIRDTSGLSATTYALADGRTISRQYEQRFNRWAPNITFTGGDADAEYTETDSIPQTYVDLTDRSFRSIVQGGSTKIIQTADSIKFKGNVTASGNISASGYISASSFAGDGSGITGLSSAAVSSYTNTGNNRVVTSVDSSTVNSEANLTFDGSTLSVTGAILTTGTLSSGHITSSGNISASGTIIAQDVIAGGVFEGNLKTQNIGDNLTGTIVVWEEDKLIPCYKSEDELVMGVIRQGRDEPIVLGAELVLVTGKVNVGNYIVTSDKQGHGKSVNVVYLFKK